MFSSTKNRSKVSPLTSARIKLVIQVGFLIPIIIQNVFEHHDIQIIQGNFNIQGNFRGNGTFYSNFHSNGNFQGNVIRGNFHIMHGKCINYILKILHRNR